MHLVPIGKFEGVWRQKNGTPRQGNIVPSSRGIVTVDWGNNSRYALEGLEDFSHVWLLFWFHDNGEGFQPTKMKVAPPRLGGDRIGVLASRSPHRPNPIGMTVAKIEKIDGANLHVSGIDLINGTPILDIKPYIPRYDGIASAKSAPWVQAQTEVSATPITFTAEFEQQLSECLSKLRFFNTVDAVKEAIVQVLHSEPRSVHWRTKRADEEYFFRIDTISVHTLFLANEIRVLGVNYWPPNKLQPDETDPKRSRHGASSSAAAPIQQAVIESAVVNPPAPAEVEPSADSAHTTSHDNGMAT